MGWQDRHKIVPAVYLIFERDDSYLLMRRANTGYQDGDYSLPAGHLNGNEPPTVAAAREGLEEVGLTVDPRNLRLAHCVVYMALEGDHERVSFFFIADRFTGDPQNMEPDKCDDLQWFPKDDLPENLVPEVSSAIVEIQKGVIYAERY